MSIEKRFSARPDAARPDGDDGAAAGQGGWRVKERKPDPEHSLGAMTPPDDQQDQQGASPGEDPPGVMEEPEVSAPFEAEAAPPAPEEPLFPYAKDPHPRPKRRFPLLLLAGGMTIGILLALVAVGVQYWLRDAPTGALGRLAASAATSGADAVDEAGNHDFWLQAIALPALENEGELPIYFRLSAPADWPIEVTYETVADTAEAETDFIARRGVIVVPPGDKTVELTIPLIDDDQIESIETFTILLSVDPALATLIDTQLTATVLDDDGIGKSAQPQ